MGTLILAAATSTKKPTDFLPIVIIVVLFGLMYMFLIRPQRNRQRQAAQTQRQVADGARIRTTAGIYGTVISGDDADVIVEIAPGVRIKMMRRAIMNEVPDEVPDDLSDPSFGDSSFSDTPDTGADTPKAKSDDSGDLSI